MITAAKYGHVICGINLQTKGGLTHGLRRGLNCSPEDTVQRQTKRSWVENKRVVEHVGVRLPGAPLRTEVSYLDSAKATKRSN